MRELPNSEAFSTDIFIKLNAKKKFINPNKFITGRNYQASRYRSLENLRSEKDSSQSFAKTMKKGGEVKGVMTKKIAFLDLSEHTLGAITDRKLRPLVKKKLSAGLIQQTQLIQGGGAATDNRLEAPTSGIDRIVGRSMIVTSEKPLLTTMHQQSPPAARNQSNSITAVSS